MNKNVFILEILMRKEIGVMHVIMLKQSDTPDDYVVATGVTTSVREFLLESFRAINVELIFEGIVRVRVDPRYFRPTEVDLLIGDPTKIKNTLGWKATTKIKDLCHEMVTADIELAKKGLHNA
eukprot:GSMAST32.ASY1.ANO1.230.1 assembled CDS